MYRSYSCICLAGPPCMDIGPLAFCGSPPHTAAEVPRCMPQVLPNDFLDEFPELEALVETTLWDLPDALFQTAYFFG
eukprot:SAG22_NODE_11513_length_481_cov_0.774869_1_plen_76_part_10